MGADSKPIAASKLGTALLTVSITAGLLSSQSVQAASALNFFAANPGRSSGFPWDTTTLNWLSPSSAPSAWVNGSAAVFPDNASTIFVNVDDPSGTVSAAGLTVQNGAYLVQGEPVTLTNPNVAIQPLGELIMNAPIAGTAGFNLTSGLLHLGGKNTYTGATNFNGGTSVFVTNGGFGNTAITGSFTVASYNGAANISAGTTGPGTAGATLNTGQLTMFGAYYGLPATLALNQESGFTGTALTLNHATLNFSVDNTAVDEISVNGPGTASVIGTQTINLNLSSFSSTLVPESFALINDPSGGLTGNFQFTNGLTTEIIGEPTGNYAFALSNTGTAETLTISAVPEPTTTAACAGVLLLLARRKRRACSK